MEMPAVMVRAVRVLSWSGLELALLGLKKRRNQILSALNSESFLLLLHFPGQHGHGSDASYGDILQAGAG